MGKKKKKQKNQQVLDQWAHAEMEDSEIAAHLTEWADDPPFDDDGEYKSLLYVAADRLTRPTEGQCPVCGREMGDLDAPGSVASRPQATSGAAALITRGSDRWDVLMALFLGGKTADGVAAHVHKSPNQTAARLKELRDGGYVQYVRVEGEKIKLKTRAGRAAYAQELSQEGRKLVARLREGNR